MIVQLHRLIVNSTSQYTEHASLGTSLEAVAAVSGPGHDVNSWRRLEVELAPATYSSEFRLLVDTNFYNIYISVHAVDTCLGGGHGGGGAPRRHRHR